MAATPKKKDRHDDSEISLRDVALNFQPYGEYNKDYEVTKSCRLLHPNRATHDFS